ncbi:MAG: serine hydrolase domain-containing protein [Bryobacteraceae bacterium]
MIQAEVGRDPRAPSLAVAVARRGEVLWEEAFGWADKEEGIRANEHTVYSLASISKPITATGLMVLASEGRIGLDEPVNRYLGAAKLTARVGRAEEATVRRVANHTSGLPLHYQFFYADEAYPVPTPEETIRRYGRLVAAPGERYEYSNLGYGVLGYLIERVSGQGFAEFMRERVFEPLGLRRMWIGNGAIGAAVRYDDDGRPIPDYDVDHPGASSAFASVHDLLRFGMFHAKAGGRAAVLDEAAIEAMQIPTAETLDGGGYGIGWSIEERDGYRRVSHTGGMGGVRTVLVLVPSEGIVVAALCNGPSSLPMRVSDEILAMMLPRRGGEGLAAAPAKRLRFRPGPEWIGTWEGTLEDYRERHPVRVEITRAGEVMVELDGQPRAAMAGVRWSDGSVTGRVPVSIDTEDAERTRHFVILTLKLRGDVLNGPATAITYPGKRVGNAVTSFVELRMR